MRTDESAADPKNVDQRKRLTEHRLMWGDAADDEADQIWIAALEPSFRSLVYAEKYAMFRHFDSLRWQIPGLIFAIGGALFGFGPKQADGWPHFVASLLYGVFALFGAYLMHRIRLNLRANNESLRKFAVSVGDYGVPPPTSAARSASTWMHLLLAVIGVASIIMGVRTAVR